MAEKGSDYAMEALAENLWDGSFRDKVDGMLQGAVRSFRAEVVENTPGNALVVRTPFSDSTMTLPCVPSIKGAIVGSQVTVLCLGSLSNAIVLGDGRLSNL